MRLFTAALIIGLAGCGRPMDPVFWPYMERYMALVKEAGLEPEREIVWAEFSDDVPEGAKASCKNGKMRFRAADWPATDLGRAVLIYHEMGHCYLGLKHSPDSASYMHRIPLVGTFSVNNIEVLNHTVLRELTVHRR
jgi:hypothetical protein